MKRRPGCYPETSEEALQKLGFKRRIWARQIAHLLDRFKLCDLCLCIVHRDTGLCPLCGGYIFDFDQERLAFITAISGSRDMGMTEPVIPRIQVSKTASKSKSEI